MIQAIVRFVRGMLVLALIGGLIGAAVDASDGSAMEHKPNPLVVQLEKQ